MADNVGELTIDQLFKTPVITRVVSRFKTPISLFQNFLGMLPGQPASQTVPGRHAGWDIFDSTRTLAKGRAPGVGPATTTRKRVGHVSAVLYRAHEKVTMLQEEIFRTRAPGQQIGVVDTRGQNYINRQLRFITQRFRNSREFMVAHMLRGGFDIKQTGDDFEPVATGAGDFAVNFQIPAGNLTDLDMLGAGAILGGAWQTDSTYIILELLNINAAFEQLHGRPLRHIFINSTEYNNLIRNLDFIAVGGSAFRVFESLSTRELRSEEGIPDSGFDVVFRAVPLYTFHVYDGVLSEGVEGAVDETTSANSNKLIPDNKAIFMAEPDPDWIGSVEGSEIVAENLVDVGQERFGFHSWSTRIIDPPGWDLKMLDNWLPALYIPKCVAFGDVSA